MKKITQNSFGKGLNMDLNPLSTPKDVLTDCLNGTIITYNGDDFNLQTELGNVKVKTTGTNDALPQGFIPLGVKEFNGVMYIVAHNPFTKETSVGSLPSPQRYITISDGDNKSLKTIGNLSAETSQLGIELQQSTAVNHGMNLLNAFISPGDKFKIAITLVGIDTWNTANQILSKFINNYGLGGEGYFDFKYYTMNVDGGLTAIPINLLPTFSEGISNVSYLPEPTDIAGDKNGIDIVYNGDSKGVITVIISPASIKSFDFGLAGDNTNSILKAKISFSPNSIELNSAIKVTTIEIKTSSTDGETTAPKFFDYAQYITADVTTNANIFVTKENLPDVPVSFASGTVITVTCTPIDQFGRRLEKFAKTKSYVVSSLPAGADAHDHFTYSISPTNLLTVNYNFLYKGQDAIPVVNIEFYDFWSNVSFLKEGIPLSNQEATVAIPLEIYPKDKIFNGVSQGGLPVAKIGVYAGSAELLSGTRLMLGTTLRKNHCYLVRIFGNESGLSYNIFQLLYTLPIARFENSNMRNYGMIDIIRGLEVGNRYDLNYAGTGILDKSLSLIMSSGTVSFGEDHANYIPTTGHPNPSPNEAYRLYGAPVFCEVMEEGSVVKVSDWTAVKKYYRNAYTGKYADVTSDAIKNIGYHIFSEIATKMGITGGDIVMNPSLFIKGKTYLTSGLSVDYSQKDFQFQLLSDCVSTINPLGGTINLLPENSAGKPLLFGEIDNTLFKKKLTLKSLEYTSPTNAFEKLVSFNNITHNFTWLAGPPVNPIDIASSARLKASLVTTDILDTFAISDIFMYSQRPTIAGSLFKTYTRAYTRMKTFKYFTWLHSQVVKSRRLAVANYNDLSTYESYELIGTDNVSYSFNLIAALPTNILANFNFLTYLGNTKVTWQLSDLNNNNIINNTITQIGGTIINMPENPSGEFISPMGTVALDSTQFIIGCTYGSIGNAIPQTIYQIYKTRVPINVDIKLNDSLPLLYIYNSLWLSDNPTFPYIGMAKPDYVNSLIVSQNYMEVLLAQYANKDLINYVTAGIDSILLDNNSILYTLMNPDIDTNLKYLTKSNFGTPVSEPFNVSKFQNIITSWILLHPTAKVLYNFVDPNPTMQTGNAKNIPWNFTGKDSCTALISPLNLSLTKETPTIKKDLFTNALLNLETSAYLTPSIAVTPSIKAILAGSLKNIVSKYFTLIDSPAENNINGSVIKIPKLTISELSGRLIEVISPQFGIKKFCLDPPSIFEIVNGRTYNIGDKFGGGIIFYILQPGDLRYDATTTHGLISAPERLTGLYWAGSEEVAVMGSQPINIDSIGAGAQNTGLMMANNVSKMSDTAAFGASTYVSDNYTGWYLPSKDELERLFVTRQANPSIFSFMVLDQYWSSSENDYRSFKQRAWLLDSFVPRLAAFDKIAPKSIIPIRSF